MSSANSLWKSSGGLDEFLQTHEKMYDAHISFESQSNALTCENHSSGRLASWAQAPLQWFSRQFAYWSDADNVSKKNREGIKQVRNLIADKYDENAARRFDAHFNYRNYWGKPLTLQALRNFVVEENKLRGGTINLRQLEIEEKESEEEMDDLTVGQKKTLETFKSKLGSAKLGSNKDSSKDKIIIGCSAQESDAEAAQKEPTFTMGFREAFLQIKEYAFGSADFYQGRGDGVKEARDIILGRINKDHARECIGHLFNTHFAEKIEKAEPLKVEELSTFIDDAIKVRDAESGWLGFLHSLMSGAAEKASEGEEAVKSFVKETYHAMGIAAKASTLAQETANAGDPITLALKTVFVGVLAAEETDTEAILTACMLHYTGGTPVQKSSWSAGITKHFLTGGLL